MPSIPHKLINDLDTWLLKKTQQYLYNTSNFRKKQFIWEIIKDFLPPVWRCYPRMLVRFIKSLHSDALSQGNFFSFEKMRYTKKSKIETGVSWGNYRKYKAEIGCPLKLTKKTLLKEVSHTMNALRVLSRPINPIWACFF